MTELEELKARLKKLENRPGWNATAEAVKKRIEELEA
jgi:hypothetical protein